MKKDDSRFPRSQRFKKFAKPAKPTKPTRPRKYHYTDPAIPRTCPICGNQLTYHKKRDYWKCELCFTEVWPDADKLNAMALQKYLDELQLKENERARWSVGTGRCTMPVGGTLVPQVDRSKRSSNKSGKKSGRKQGGRSGRSKRGRPRVGMDAEALWRKR